MIRFWCECGRQVQASEKDAGQVAVCPLCRRQMTVPQGDLPRHGPAAVSPGSQQFTGRARTTSDLLRPDVPQGQATAELTSRHRGRKWGLWGCLGLLAVLLLVVVPLAIQRKQAPVGAVEGRVHLRIAGLSAPLKGGSVGFHPAKGEVIRVAISPDGKYSVSTIQPGTMKVTVETESVARAAGMGLSKNYIGIPRKYADPMTTPLTINVKPGRQTVNFDLTN